MNDQFLPEITDLTDTKEGVGFSDNTIRFFTYYILVHIMLFHFVSSLFYFSPPRFGGLKLKPSSKFPLE